MDYLERVLDISLPEGQSAFLWGPRKTGKSTYLKHLYPGSITYDFLKTDLRLEMVKRPSLLREELSHMDDDLLSRPVILDEIQKAPEVLDEVHYMIENMGLRFIMCGSSARKLRRGKANMLGGRAWRFEMSPFVTPEIPCVDLLKILNRGTIPVHYSSDSYRRSLKAYLQDYITEEVFEEGLTRNLPAFSRFIDALGYSHGELTNYTNIARECGVTANTTREYYHILADTLFGKFVEPFKKRKGRDIIVRAPKFYLFDVGVAGAITGRQITEEKGELFGKAFEHFVFTEISAHSRYRELDYAIDFWRTKTGLEVDFVLGGGEVAVEVKGTRDVSNRDLRPLLAFVEEHSPRDAFLVANVSRRRTAAGIKVVPWRAFLDDLWSGKIMR